MAGGGFLLDLGAYSPRLGLRGAGASRKARESLVDLGVHIAQGTRRCILRGGSLEGRESRSGSRGIRIAFNPQELRLQPRDPRCVVGARAAPLPVGLRFNSRAHLARNLRSWGRGPVSSQPAGRLGRGGGGGGVVCVWLKLIDLQRKRTSAVGAMGGGVRLSMCRACGCLGWALGPEFSPAHLAVLGRPGSALRNRSRAAAARGPPRAPQKRAV